MVRPARIEDVSRVFELMLALAEYERLLDKFVGSEENLRKHLFGDPRFAECLVAEMEDCVVGYALFFPTFSTFLTRPGYWLEDLFVLPEARAKGLGKALLAEVCRLARSHGFARVDWTVLNWNEPSIRFYDSIGATPLSDWTVYRLEGVALEEASRGATRAPLGMDGD